MVSFWWLGVVVGLVSGIIIVCKLRFINGGGFGCFFFFVEMCNF